MYSMHTKKSQKYINTEDFFVSFYNKQVMPVTDAKIYFYIKIYTEGYLQHF